MLLPRNPITGPSPLTVLTYRTMQSLTMRNYALRGSVAAVLVACALLAASVEAKMVGDMRVAVITGANRGIGAWVAFLD